MPTLSFLITVEYTVKDPYTDRPQGVAFATKNGTITPDGIMTRYEVIREILNDVREGSGLSKDYPVKIAFFDLAPNEL